MNYWLDIRLKIRDFFRRHKKKIYIAICIWAVVFAVNYFMKNRKKIELPFTTYQPHSPVIDTTDAVPEKYKEPISKLIESYIEYCNNKEYENAYNLLGTAFKELYCKDLESFKKYVDNNFKTKKIYNIQNFSNVNNVYIYNVRFMDDILASGTTDGYEYAEQKFAIREENGELKISLNGYCGAEDLNIDVEDDFLKIKVTRKDIEYDKEVYTVEVKNKTNYFAVLADNTENNEVLLQLPNERRKIKNITNANLVVLPHDTKTMKLMFTKYIYDNEEASSIIFDTIRILPEFTGETENAAKEKEKAIKLYSLTVNLK